MHGVSIILAIGGIRRKNLQLFGDKKMLTSIIYWLVILWNIFNKILFIFLCIDIIDYIRICIVLYVKIKHYQLNIINSDVYI